MYKESKKHPILTIVLSTDNDTLINRVYRCIYTYPIRWMAIEQLENCYNGEYINQHIKFVSNKNDIEFRDTHNNFLLARIRFDLHFICPPQSFHLTSSI